MRAALSPSARSSPCASNQRGHDRAREHSGRTSWCTTTGALPAPAAWVQRLQVDLGRLGFFQGPDTGIYGPLTTAAVERFQRAAGIAIDGRWGPTSQRALVNRLGSAH